MGIFSKPETHSVLLVDIASSSVGVGLSGIRDKDLPELVFTARVPFAYRKDFDHSLIEHACMYALRDALGIALREGTKLLRQHGYPNAINHAIISLSSPWYLSELGTDPKSFRSRLEEQYGSPIEVFESKHGVMSATERRFVRRVEDEIIRIFGVKQGIELSSFTFTLSRIVSHAFHNPGPTMFVDMTGHMTDILSMKDGAYHGNFSVPAGVHTLKHRDTIPWAEFWSQITNSHHPDFHTGTIFLIADEYTMAHEHLLRVLPRSRVVPFGASRGFITEMVRVVPTQKPIERLAILATYSNLFL